jgi:hypothetical protein
LRWLSLLPIDLVFGQSVDDFNMYLYRELGDAMSHFLLSELVTTYPTRDGSDSDDDMRGNAVLV